MRIEIEIPKEFEEHFNKDKFKDTLERIMANIEHSLENRDCLCAGRYKYETIEMLEKAFENSRQAYDIDKIVDELEKELEAGNIAIDYGEFRLFEIVKQGGVSDDVCDTKQHKWIFDKFTAQYGNPYRCSCCNEEFGDTYNYCPNCGVSMKEVE